MHHIIRSLARTLPALLAPQQNACHLCQALLHAGESILCEDCQWVLSRCRIHPLEAAAHAEPPVTLVLSAYWHQDEARALVHWLKYDHDRLAALPLAQGMSDAYAQSRALITPIDGVAAVPVHPSRLKERGYNQAELLAHAFCRYTTLPYFSGVLTRVHHSASQVHRTRLERLSAMEHAFVAAPGVKGMRLLLVDDVYTTGATAAACAQALLNAGAVSVTVLTAVQA